MKKFFMFISLIAVAFVSALIVKAEMPVEKRIAIIKALKLNGTIGENNKGLLEFRTSDRKAAAVVEEENAYRLKNYKEIAAKTSSTPEAVGAERAKQIQKEDPPGVWHQDQSGNWKKK